MGKTIIKSKQFMKNKTKLLQLLASVTTDENNRIKLDLLTLMTSNQYVTRTKLKPYNNKKKHWTQGCVILKRYSYLIFGDSESFRQFLVEFLNIMKV